MSSWYHDTPFQPERGKFQRDLSIKGACDHVVDHEVTEPYAGWCGYRRAALLDPAQQ